jgi:hypothetical protein
MVPPWDSAAHRLDSHEKVVQILLEAMADVNVQGGEYGYALQAASEDGHEKVMSGALCRRFLRPSHPR